MYFQRHPGGNMFSHSGSSIFLLLCRRWAVPIHSLLSESNAVAHPLFAANSHANFALPYTFNQRVGAIAFTAW